MRLITIPLNYPHSNIKCLTPLTKIPKNLYIFSYFLLTRESIFFGHANKKSMSTEKYSSNLILLPTNLKVHEIFRKESNFNCQDFPFLFTRTH